MMNAVDSLLESSIEINLARRLRHKISTGLSFIETSVRSMSSNHSDASKAFILYSDGTRRLREAMAELDRLIDDANHAEKMEDR